MNERIEQLIKQSYGHEDSNGDRYFNKELFAELIVKECASIAHFLAPTNDSAEALHQGIKQYFGVE